MDLMRRLQFCATGLALLLATISHFACSAGGPPFRSAPAGAPAGLQGSYAFHPALPFFKSDQRGEVYFRSAHSRQPKTLFFLRVFGRDDEDVIRVRQYEGSAIEVEGRLELRSERCYLFGKRNLDDRLTALERWDCDHLIFAFARQANQVGGALLQPLTVERSEFSNWFQMQPLFPLPLSNSGASPAHFAAQVIAIREEQSLPENADVVVWGMYATELTRNGNVLEAEDGEGRPAGRLRIVARVSDFLFCKWLERGPGRPAVAYTLKSQVGGVQLF
ncbi:MAG: hypothetical protein K1X75_11080 [Leptospirales bacterium]|nr:hypothetical protein [Leptospirales bacterium]